MLRYQVILAFVAGLLVSGVILSYTGGQWKHLPQIYSKLQAFVAVKPQPGDPLTNKSGHPLRNKPVDPLRYSPPGKSNISGKKRFNLSSSLLKKLHLPLTDFVQLNNQTVRNHIFVTGVSSNHFAESRDAIAAVQNNMPHSKIIFYGMNLKPSEVAKVKRYCNVEFRALDFSKYPNHVRHFGCYAFKPVIIQECLHEFPGCMWFDASVRVRKDTFEKAYPEVLKTNGFMTFDPTDFPQDQLTDKRVYEYLPAASEFVHHAPQFGANSILVFRTKKVYQNIVYWWVLCALVEECTYPKGIGVGCNFKLLKTIGWARCHRFDQSLLNILGYNLYQNKSRAHPAMKGLLSVERGVTSHYTSKFC